jgi:Domain of unknown function (DUF4265)
MNEPKKEDMVKVILDVSDDTFGISGERVWAIPLGGDLYEIRNTPWHTCDVNWGDVVRAVAPSDNEWPRFVEVVRRSGHRTIHLFFYKDTEEKYRSDVLGRLKEWKANYENGDGKLYAVDIQPDGDLEGLFGYLEKLDTAKVDYRDEVSPIKS